MVVDCKKGLLKGVFFGLNSSMPGYIYIYIYIHLPGSSGCDPFLFGLFKVTFSRVKMVNSDLHLGDQRVTWKKAGIYTCNCFVDEAI